VAPKPGIANAPVYGRPMPTSAEFAASPIPKNVLAFQDEPAQLTKYSLTSGQYYVVVNAHPKNQYFEGCDYTDCSGVRRSAHSWQHQVHRDRLQPSFCLREGEGCDGQHALIIKEKHHEKPGRLCERPAGHFSLLKLKLVEEVNTKSCGNILLLLNSLYIILLHFTETVLIDQLKCKHSYMNHQELSLSLHYSEQIFGFGLVSSRKLLLYQLLLQTRCLH
jgi:hypothetical protein